MPEALALVKRYLGCDAVILHTRSARVGGILGWRTRAVVEITASDHASVRVRPAPQPDLPSPRTSTQPGPLKSVAAAAYQRQSRMEAIPEPVVAGVSQAPEAKVDREAVLVPVRARSVAARPSGPSLASTTTSDGGRSESGRGSLYRELADIKLLVNQVLQAAPAGSLAPTAGNMPEALFKHYLQLLESQVSREIADTVLGLVREELSAAELLDPQIVRATVLRHLGAMIPVAEGIVIPCRGPDGRPHTVALVGPTGVGKTTTVAKLAASYKLRQGRSVGLITSDTYRIAAVEQLRTYASIIGLPLKVVLTPTEMAAAVESFRSFDVVLIDTAGRSQNAADRLAELEQFLSAAKPHETHLVMSTASSEDVLVRAAESFACVRPNRILLTKLDEAVNFGVVANVLRRLAGAGLVAPGVGLPLSFVTTGQEVPDHIEHGRSDRLARMILDNCLTPDDGSSRTGLLSGAGAA